MKYEINDEFGSSASCGHRAPVVLTTVAMMLLAPVPLLARQSAQTTTFASPEDASHALIAAVQKHDDQALTRILGARDELVSSGDELQDALERDRFVQKYEQMHRFVQEPGGVRILYVGAENWPFPIPLVSRSGGWRFDSDGGLKEVRYRRIGENEVTAIGICHALVVAQTHSGADTEADGLVKTVLPGVDQVHGPVPFHGYYFRILSQTAGRFAAIAYPVVYRSSGVETFIVNQDDVVLEKDLGRNTAAIAGAMTAYQSGSTWTLAESIP